MHHYVEITCLPDEGVSGGFVMGKVMGVLHFSLVNLKNQLGTNPIGISFPEYAHNENGTSWIGTKIRLFSREKEHFEALNLKQQLCRLDDYIHIKGIHSLDRPNIPFATYRRVQFKSSKERLIRRQTKRTGQPDDVVRPQYQRFDEKQTSLPFIHIRSHSSTQSFRLFIQKEVAVSTHEWLFNTYGLSSTSSVPDF